MNLQQLKNMAIIATTKRGHAMGKWTDASETFSICHCKDCKRWVQVVVDPPPNGIDIAGTAVALDCED